MQLTNVLVAGAALLGAQLVSAQDDGIGLCSSLAGPGREFYTCTSSASAASSSCVAATPGNQACGCDYASAVTSCFNAKCSGPGVVFPTAIASRLERRCSTMTAGGSAASASATATGATTGAKTTAAGATATSSSGAVSGNLVAGGVSGMGFVFGVLALGAGVGAVLL